MKLSLLDLHTKMTLLGAKEISLEDYYKKCWYYEDNLDFYHNIILANIHKVDYFNATEGNISNSETVKIYCLDEHSIHSSKEDILKYLSKQKEKYQGGYNEILYPTFFFGSKDTVNVSAIYNQINNNPLFIEKLTKLSKFIDEYDL